MRNEARQGGFRSLLRQLFHFVGYYCKALSRLARARCFNRRIQGEKIRLLRNRGDHLNDLSDLRAALSQLLDSCIRRFGRRNGGGRDAGRLTRVLRNFLDTGSHLISTRRYCLNILADLFAGCGYDVRLRCSFVGVRGHLLTKLIQLLSRSDQSGCVTADLLHRISHLDSNRVDGLFELFEVSGILLVRRYGQITTGECIEYVCKIVQRAHYGIKRVINAFHNLPIITVVPGGIRTGGKPPPAAASTSTLESATRALMLSIQLLRLFLIWLKSPL